MGAMETKTSLSVPLKRFPRHMKGPFEDKMLKVVLYMRSEDCQAERKDTELLTETQL